MHLVDVKDGFDLDRLCTELAEGHATQGGPVRVRRIVIWAIACIPSWRLRGSLYRLIPGYSVDHSARIGWLSAIDVESLRLGPGSRIGRWSHLRGPMSVVLGNNAVLGGGNRVECGSWYAEFDSANAPYAREFVLGEKAMITSGHYFDAVGGIRIGEGSWIAGRGSQFWTHGLGVEDRSIGVGRYCYIGSAVRFAPGARIGNLVVVSLGSVVSHDMSPHDQALIAGVPAVVVRDDYRPAGWAALERALDDGAIAYG